jgi:hypothetical protein
MGKFHQNHLADLGMTGRMRYTVLMHEQKAVDHYLGKNGAVRLNCAQSVAVACSSGNVELLNELSTCGSGSAPNGWCGAAYAAALLLGKGSVVESTYIAKAGSVRCSEIRRNRKLSCVGCVETGAGLAASDIAEGPQK